jgi:hypothetical protein
MSHKGAQQGGMCDTTVMSYMYKPNTHQGPMPTVCGYVVDGLGFYYIPHSTTFKPKSDNTAAIIRVLEGEMIVTQIISEMERLFPVKGKWVVEKIDMNTFKTNFPSKSEMWCMIKWGAVQSKDRRAKLIIEEGGGGSTVKQAMSKVWNQMSSLLGELSDFNTIWTIGTILGVTRDVDMKFTHEFERARLQVLVVFLMKTGGGDAPY